MADLKRWFKVWTSILTDPCFSCLSPDDVGRWVRLGASIATSGNNGTIIGTAEFFSRLLSCQNDIEKTINRLPNVSVKIDENCNGKFAVTMLNWNKYQLDSTGYERQQKFRNAKSVTVQDKIREDKKRKEKDNPLKSPLKGGNGSSKIIAIEILEFLNQKTGKNFQPSDTNLDFITNRMKEGATPAQCRQVIAKKVREWGTDEKMKLFLRPATLFNKTKFNQYVGELVVPKEDNIDTTKEMS